MVLILIQYSQCAIKCNSVIRRENKVQISIFQIAGDNTINCTAETTYTSKYKVTLDFPDFAVDENGNTGDLISFQYCLVTIIRLIRDLFMINDSVLGAYNY